MCPLCVSSARKCKSDNPPLDPTRLSNWIPWAARVIENYMACPPPHPPSGISSDATAHSSKFLLNHANTRSFKLIYPSFRVSNGDRCDTKPRTHTQKNTRWKINQERRGNQVERIHSLLKRTCCFQEKKKKKHEKTRNWRRLFFCSSFSSRRSRHSSSLPPDPCRNVPNNERVPRGVQRGSCHARAKKKKKNWWNTGPPVSSSIHSWSFHPCFLSGCSCLTEILIASLIFGRPVRFGVGGRLSILPIFMCIILMMWANWFAAMACPVYFFEMSDGQTLKILDMQMLWI